MLNRYLHTLFKQLVVFERQRTFCENNGASILNRSCFEAGLFIFVFWKEKNNRLD